MELKIPTAVIDAGKKGRRFKSPVLQEARTWGDFDTIEHSHLEKGDLDALLDLCKDAPSGTKGAAALLRKIKHLKDVTAGEGKKFTDLEVLAEALLVLIRGLPHCWLFKDDAVTGEAVPYLATDASFHPAKRDRYNGYVPAYVSVSGRGIRRGDHKDFSVSIHREDLLNGMTPREALFTQGVVVETPEMVEQYEEDVAKYEALRSHTGLQLVASGKAAIHRNDDDSWWYRQEKTVQLDAHDRPGRVVIDDAEGWDTDQATQLLDSDFWPEGAGERRSAALQSLKSKRGGRKESMDPDAEISPELVRRLPPHPFLRVFDLRNGVYCFTHVRNVDKYVYDRRAFDRVILPGDTKQVIDLLVNSGGQGDDVVAGKGKGVVILSSGPPGTGKTLTAEAYSERARRPLYSVQCSQLGMDPENIEKALADFLDKCTRWGAIGLIDEADVFIRERGNDLAQNAIVGVFLRVLEYYRGVLFLTTNREDVVDDAVLSRCIVHVCYRVPGPEEAKQIWEIMFRAFGLSAVEAGWERALTERFPGVSGRTIKQLCRLVKTVTERRGDALAQMHDFEWAAQFQDIAVNPGRKGKR